MVCNCRCWNAKTDKDKCKCSCGGENHGKGYPNSDPDSMIEITLTEAEAKPYRDQMNRRFKCWMGCDYKNLHNLPIHGYTHEGGWKIRDGTYWLYVNCPNCEYGWSIWKLGVPRDFIPPSNDKVKQFLDMGGFL